MSRHERVDSQEVTEKEWVTFPGGELEGQRPKGMCPACRRRALRASASTVPGFLCFQCYRVDQARERALRSARNLNTASEGRFQDSLPFEPVNRARLEHLRAERSTARAALKSGAGAFVDRRRQAQIAARHALDRIAAGLRSRGVGDPVRQPSTVARGALDDAIHAAELQLPAAWLPFVVSR